jgi:hypothetical protein
VIEKKEKSNTLQNLLSFLILSVIVVIGTGVFISHQTYNPAVVSLENLKRSTEAPVRKQNVLKHPLLFSLPEGLDPLSPPELFDAESLSDKIDGKAELYLSADFVMLQTQR